MQVFTWKESSIRIRIESIHGNLWFVAKDLCDYLELNDVRRAVGPLDDDEKLTGEILQSGQMRSMWLVNESGMYALIIRSRKPGARKFRKWITNEVIPSIRKTGRYELTPRRRVLPRERSVKMAGFFDELTKWVTLEDERLIAKQLNVGAKHVHEVLRGRTQSYGVAYLLVEFAKENRRSGIERVLRSTSREAEMKELMLEFTEE